MRTIAELTRGQMMRKDITPQLFIFDREHTIHLHTFFCLKPLHITYLDQDLRVTKSETVAPWRLCSGHGSYVLETLPGTVKTQPGQQWTFSEIA